MKPEDNLARPCGQLQISVKFDGVDFGSGPSFLIALSQSMVKADLTLGGFLEISSHLRVTV